MTKTKAKKSQQIKDIKDPIDRLFAFVHERYMIHIRRQAGDKPPWTKDEILSSFRFCNIFREDDKVTTWIRENWRTPHEDDEDLWFAMCIARVFNQPATLEAIGYPVPFEELQFAQKLNRWEKAGNKVFNGAYIVSTNGISMKKIVYFHNEIFKPLWKNRVGLRPKKEDTLQSYHLLLGQMQGFGSFMTAQVIADLKYHEPLSNASDWNSFAASGPGSRRGLNYVLERNRKSPWREDEWRLELSRLREKLLPMFKHEQMPQPHAQDIQNCLCEYNKYHAAVFEGKKPKQKYRVGGSDAF